MCFYHESAWYAELVETESCQSNGSVMCEECHRIIPEGEGYTHTYIQEHEECQRCYNGECACVDDGDCECEECRCDEPEYGESYEYDTCTLCQKVLKAIEAVEIANGCKGEETQPGVGELKTAMWHDEGGAYAARALQMCPDIGPHLELLKGQA